MTTARPAFGSATWIAAERSQATEYLEQELDEFRCSALNELEWLNENMSDIFTKSRQKFADVFKTPSKLRGKTPRTIRKTDPRHARAPLTDIFAPNSPAGLPLSPSKAFLSRQPSPFKQISQPSPFKIILPPQQHQQSPPKPAVRVPSPQRITASSASFVSAKEHDSPSSIEANVGQEDVQMEEPQQQQQQNVEVEEKRDVEMEDVPSPIHVYQSDDDHNPIENKENEPAIDDVEVDAHSDPSSPEQEAPLHRKSSFTFSSLPAREPLHQKFKSTSILPNLAPTADNRTSVIHTDSVHKKSDSVTTLPAFNGDRETNNLLSATETPLQKSKSTPALPKVVAEVAAMTPVRPNMHQKSNSTTVVPSPSAPEGESTAHKNRLWSAIKSAKKIFASSAGTSAAAKVEAHSNDDDLETASIATTKTAAPPAGKLRAPGRLARPTKEVAQSKPAPAIIRVASQSQRMGQGHAPQPSLSKSTNERPAPPSRDGSSRVPPAMAGRVKALEAAAKKKEADEKAAARKAEQKLEIERKRTEAKVQKEAEERRKAEAEERKRAEAKQQKEAEERRRAEVKAQREADKEAEETRSRAAHDLAETIKRERAAQNPPHPRSDVPGTLRQLTKTLKPALKRPMEPAPPAEPKRRRTNEEPDEQMGGMGPSRPSVMAPPKRPSTMRKVCSVRSSGKFKTNDQQENIGKFNHGYSHAPPPAAHHASGMFKSANSNQMQHLQHKPMHPSHLVQMSSARIPFAGSESADQQRNYPGPAQSHSSRPFTTTEISNQHHYTQQQSNPQMYKTPARPVAHMVPKSSQAPKSAGTILGDNIELPEIMTDSEDEDDDEGGGGFRVPSWAATPALKVQLEDQQLIDPETVFGPIGEMNMEEMFRNGKNTERLKQFRNRGSSALWVENRDQITSAEKRRDRELRAEIVRDGGWRYDPGAMRREA